MHTMTYTTLCEFGFTGPIILFTRSNFQCPIGLFRALFFLLFQVHAFYVDKSEEQLDIC